MELFGNAARLRARLCWRGELWSLAGARELLWPQLFSSSWAAVLQLSKQLVSCCDCSARELL